MGGDASRLGIAVPSQRFTMRLGGRTMETRVSRLFGTASEAGKKMQRCDRANEAEFGDGGWCADRARSLRNNGCAPNWWLSKLRGGTDGDGDDGGSGSRGSLCSGAFQENRKMA
jgi:hypothetical protein